MKSKLFLLVVFVILIGLLAACVPLAQPATEPTSPPSPTPTTAAPGPTVTPAPTVTTPFITDTLRAPEPVGSREALQAVQKAAAQEAGVAPESVTVHRVKHEDWPDASLGCPKIGVMYIQVITPGWRIVVEAGGKTYEYHTDESGANVVLCQPG